jgi:cell shape-determining protein MreD
MTVGVDGLLQSQLWRARLWNILVTGGSALLCLMLLPGRAPGLDLLGVAPHWVLIWVVAWSVKRTVWEGAIAGLVMGLLQDSMTAPYPTHTLGLVLVGVLTAQLQGTVSAGRSGIHCLNRLCHGSCERNGASPTD